MPYKTSLLTWLSGFMSASVTIKLKLAYTELLLSYMIKFETGRCSCLEDDVHQRKESQTKVELPLINHMKSEQITVA